MDSEASPDNLPVSDTPGEGVESATVKEASAQDNSNIPEEEVAARPVSSIDTSRPSSPNQDQDLASSPPEQPASPGTKSSSPRESRAVSREPSETREARSSSPQRRSSPSIPGKSETSQPSSPRPEAPLLPLQIRLLLTQQHPQHHLTPPASQDRRKLIPYSLCQLQCQDRPSRQLITTRTTPTTLVGTTLPQTTPSHLLATLTTTHLHSSTIMTMERGKRSVMMRGARMTGGGGIGTGTETGSSLREGSTHQ